MKHILVTGGNSLLAHALRGITASDYWFTFLSHAEFDLLNPDLISQRLAELRPQVVINPAAYNLVDQCEVERDLSWAVNATSPQRLADLCAQQEIVLVHYGTDYVFDGANRSPYSEMDAPHPVNHYAAGKLAGEQAVLRASPQHLVLRTSWLFGWHPTQSKTFVHTMLKAAKEGRALKGTTDQASVPTFAPDLAHWTLELIRQGATGLIHAVNDEGVSRWEWAKIIVEEAAEAKLIAAAPPVEPVLSTFFNSTMRRPNYTVLSNALLTKRLGRPAGSWRPGLRKMLGQISGGTSSASPTNG